MNKTKVAVLVSGGGTNLQKILEAQAAGNMPHAEVVLVLSDHKDAYALTRAKNFGVATAVVEKTGTQADFESDVIAALRVSGAEMIVLAGFLRILTENFIKEYENKIINVHPSLIPSFCGKGFYGLKVHQAALDKGVKVTGATVHFVNEIPDGGAIIAQKAVEVKEGDTPEILQKRVMEEAEWILLPQAVETVAQKIYMEKAL
jgi:phosphoribosylglycinamide formyltransferase-1